MYCIMHKIISLSQVIFANCSRKLFRFRVRQFSGLKYYFTWEITPFRNLFSVCPGVRYVGGPFQAGFTVFVQIQVLHSVLKYDGQPQNQNLRHPLVGVACYAQFKWHITFFLNSTGLLNNIFVGTLNLRRLRQLSRYSDPLRAGIPEIKFRWGRDFSCRPDRPRSPSSLLYTGYRVVPTGKRAGARC